MMPDRDGEATRSVLRIGYLVQQFVPEVGAGPARVLEMGRHWVERGAGLTVLTGMPNRPVGRIYPGYRGRLVMEERVEGIRVLRSWLYASPKHGFGRTAINNTSFAITGAVNGLARRRDYDVLIASAPPILPHAAGAVLAAAKRVPLVLELRDLWPDYLVDMGTLRKDGRGARALFGFERRLLRRAVAVVVVTESFRERVIAKGIPGERVHVIPNGVDAGMYHPVAEPPPLDELTPRDGEPVVGYLGNFGAGQDLRVVLQAAAHLRGEGVSARFVLAGDGTEAASVRRWAAELALPGLSIHPPIPKSDTRAFYNNCDVCLVPLAAFPSMQATVPSKLFEILACGRPVVASMGGEGARVIRESGAGVSTPPGDAHRLARAIDQILRLPREERNAMGRKGVDWVRRNHSRSHLADRYLDLLESVTGLAPASSGS